VSLSDELESREQDADLRSTNLRLLRQLDKAKASKEELVDAVYRAATDAARSLVIPPVTRPERDRRRGKAEVAVAMLSDWQLGKKTPTYSSEVCEERVRRYGHKVVELAGIQRADHPVRELRVWLLGDLVEGELIFPGQSHRIDASLYRQVTVDGPRILGEFLRHMLASFDRVRVTAVIGNHGAIGGPVRREMHPETNADTMLYRIVSQIVVDPRLTWDIADPAGERGWYAIDEIGNYRCLLFHGDQVRGGFAGFPFYGLAKKVWGWASGGLSGDFNDVALGHWHTPTRVTLNRVTARVNGSTESDNTYAQEQLASSGRPSQWLYFVEPTRGRVTAEYLVSLDD
jgi:hypothetical protein